jgi:hypothetical protein
MRLAHPYQKHAGLLEVLIFLWLNSSDCFKIPTTTRSARTVTTLHPQTHASNGTFHPLAYAPDRLHTNPLTAISLSRNYDSMDGKSTMDKEEQEKLQMEIDAMMNPPQSSASNANALFGGFDADAFDESKLPLPLFSSLVIFVVTTYLTGYMFYIGIMGFPEKEIVPRIF